MMRTWLACLMLLAGTAFADQAGFYPQKTTYTAQMNQCLSCTSTRYPPLRYAVMGGYVSLGKHKLWVERYGKGGPAVILINGGGETNRQWNLIIPAVATYTTVVAYDRQGLGRSDNIDFKPRTAKEVVERLHTILGIIQVKPPYVLVGHSIGGLYVSYFARRYPQEVAGIVTLDGNNQYQLYWDHLDATQLKPGSEKKLKAMTQPHQVYKQAIAKARQALSKKTLSPIEFARLIEDLEVAGKPQSARQIVALGRLPSVPLIALTEGAGLDYYYWHASVRQFSNEVPCGEYRWVANSGHHIMLDQPVVVNAAIKKVVMAARAHQSLCLNHTD